jgi:hypothetical protein
MEARNDSRSSIETRIPTTRRPPNRQTRRLQNFDVNFSRPALAFAAALISSTALAITAPAAALAAVQAVVPTVHYHTVKVDGIDIFYREAGPRARPSCFCCTASRPPRTCSAI